MGLLVWKASANQEDQSYYYVIIILTGLRISWILVLARGAEWSDLCHIESIFFPLLDCICLHSKLRVLVLIGYDLDNLISCEWDFGSAVETDFLQSCTWFGFFVLQYNLNDIC